MKDTPMARVRFVVGLSLSLMLASGSSALAQGTEFSAPPSPASLPDEQTRAGLEAGPEWSEVVSGRQGPGQTWIEHGLGGMVAVLQPDEGVAEAWRSGDGLTWAPITLPADLGTVSDVVSLRGDLALITDEVRSADTWSFDLWTTDDGADWRPVGSTSFEPHPDLLDRPRTSAEPMIQAHSPAHQLLP